MKEFIQTCPHCNSELQMQNEWSGMEINCPLCQNKIIVAQPFLQQTPPLGKSVQYSPLAADEKTCPACGNVIKSRAIFCKHCKCNLSKHSDKQNKHPQQKEISWKEWLAIAGFIVAIAVSICTCTGIITTTPSKGRFKSWRKLWPLGVYFAVLSNFALMTPKRKK